MLSIPPKLTADQMRSSHSVNGLHPDSIERRHFLVEKAKRRVHQQLSARGLTRREVEVLCWVKKGKSNRDIAAILNLKTATVKKHLERIYPKLGVENRTAAAYFAPNIEMSDNKQHRIPG